MKNLKLNNSIYLLVALSAIIWLSLSKIYGQDLSHAKSFLKFIPTVVTIDLIFIAIFTQWLWKFKVFRGWLVPFPNLNGTWVGKIYSDWVDIKTGQKNLPIPAMLTINQNFLSISCVMHTSEMKSQSLSEGLFIDTERQIKQVSYLYNSAPSVTLRDRSTPHNGAIIFDIIDNPERKLKGQYWTERKTTGEIILSFHDKKKYEEMPKELS